MQEYHDATAVLQIHRYQNMPLSGQAENSNQIVRSSNTTDIHVYEDIQNEEYEVPSDPQNRTYESIKPQQRNDDNYTRLRISNVQQPQDYLQTSLDRDEGYVDMNGN